MSRAVITIACSDNIAIGLYRDAASKIFKTFEICCHLAPVAEKHIERAIRIVSDDG